MQHKPLTKPIYKTTYKMVQINFSIYWWFWNVILKEKHIGFSDKHLIWKVLYTLILDVMILIIMKMMIKMECSDSVVFQLFETLSSNRITHRKLIRKSTQNWSCSSSQVERGIQRPVLSLSLPSFQFPSHRAFWKVMRHLWRNFVLKIIGLTD